MEERKWWNWVSLNIRNPSGRKSLGQKHSIVSEGWKQVSSVLNVKWFVRSYHFACAFAYAYLTRCSVWLTRPLSLKLSLRNPYAKSFGWFYCKRSLREAFFLPFQRQWTKMRRTKRMNTRMRMRSYWPLGCFVLWLNPFAFSFSHFSCSEHGFAEGGMANYWDRRVLLTRSLTRALRVAYARNPSFFVLVLSNWPLLCRY